MLTKRTNILFDEKLWNLLVAHASDQNTSVGELIRSAARKVYGVDMANDQRNRVCESILSLRKKQKKKLNHKALVNYGRKYL